MKIKLAACTVANTLHRRNVCICVAEIVYLFIFRPNIPLPSPSRHTNDPRVTLTLFARLGVFAHVCRRQNVLLYLCVRVPTIKIINAFYVWKSGGLSLTPDARCSPPKLLLFDD